MALAWIHCQDLALDEGLRLSPFTAGPLVSPEDTEAPSDSGGDDGTSRSPSCETH
ncbi:MAG: hypothetical protein QOG65_1988 [Actinomycetota bacterium]|nr:hypothetical protein [Actinomycetota bacterium]